MNSDIYVSTSCIKGQFSSINELLQKYVDASINFIELGFVSGCKSFDINPVFVNNNTRFFVHNYFPPPEKPFVLNLASKNDVLLGLSMNLCKQAIELCSTLGAPYYSVHAGFRSNISPDSLGEKIEYEEVVPYKIAFQTLVESLRTLAAYAKKRNVSLIIEPNVLSEFNLRMGRNEIALICESEEILNLMKILGSDNIGILLDTGHLNVTAKTLGFNRIQFVRDIAPYIRAMHLHDNNGFWDAHEPVKPGSWVFDVLSIHELTGLPITVEAKFSSMDDICQHVSWLGEEIKQI